MDTITVEKLEYLLMGSQISIEDKNGIIDLMEQYKSQTMPSDEEINKKISDNIAHFVYKQYRVDKFDYTKGFKEAIRFIKQYLKPSQPKTK